MAKTAAAKPVSKAKAKAKPTEPAAKAKAAVKAKAKPTKPAATAKPAVKAKPTTKPATAKPTTKSKPTKPTASPPGKKSAAPPSAAFTSVVAILADNPGIGTARMFGAHGLALGGRFFAMEYKGALVVKLPAPRVTALTAEGVGAPFDPGMGRPSREWLSVPPGRGDWQRLAEEALAFCTTLPPK